MSQNTALVRNFVLVWASVTQHANFPRVKVAASCSWSMQSHRDHSMSCQKEAVGCLDVHKCRRKRHLHGGLEESFCCY